MKKVKANKDGSITFRNRAELSKYIRQGIEKRRLDYTKEVALDASEKVGLVMLETLHLEFGFGPKRLQQFADRFYKLIDCIDEENVDWGDLGELYGKYLEEKC